MSEVLTAFKGAKGAGSSSQDFTQTPDNLRSEDTFEGLMGLAIGPIKGPTNGLKSIKLDGTPIQNSTGESNYPGFIALVNNGNPADHPSRINLRLGAAAVPQSVGVGLVNPPGGDSVWVTRTLNNQNVDYIDLRFIVQQLYKQTKKGVFNHTATLEIEMKPTGTSTWINPTFGPTVGDTGPEGKQKLKSQAGADVYAKPEDHPLPPDTVDPTETGTGPRNFVITGKTTSPVVFEARIWVPNEGAYANVTWDVRCRLIEKDTVDADPNFEKRSISWESLAGVYNDTLGEEEDWRGVAWLQFYGKASDQLSGVPEVEVETDAKVVSVPPSPFYDPETRVYQAGIWDGSWAKAWTNDPAWVINDAISDELSGLALLAPGSYLNKWDALEASKWFSEQVPDGNGGTHPRYSLNVVANQQMKAEDFIRYLAGAVGGLAWDEGDGEWRMKVDKPDNPVDLFTLETIEGEFVYAHTDVDTRFNDYTGTFLNAEMDYREDTVNIYDNESIALIGHKPTDIALIGCTNRQEAMRRLMVRMRSSVNETRMVSFTTNRRGRNVEQLDTILIADGHLGDQAARTTGRTVSIAPDRMSITLRDTMRLELGINYKLRFAHLNPVYNPTISTQPTEPDWKKPTIVAERDVTNTAGQRGDVVTVYLDEALPADLPDHLAVALEATDLPTIPKLYRVTNISYDDEDGERIAITAMEVDTGKWAAADNVSTINTIFQDLRGVVPTPLLPPDNDMLKVVRTPADQGENISLVANWQRPPGAHVSGFRVTYTVNGGAEVVLTEKTTIPTADIVNPPQGTYEFKVYTINRRGQRSQPLVATQVVDQSTIAAAEVYYSGGTETLEDLRPAEADADVTGNHESLDTANVDGVPSSTVIDSIAANTGQIASQQFDIDEILVDVDALEAAYGPTVSAAESAETALQAVEDAEAAQAAAMAAATQAGVYEGEAETHSTNAATAASNASTYQTNASNSATAAGLSASNAATSAGVASASSSAAVVQAAALLPDTLTDLNHWTQSTTGSVSTVAGFPSTNATVVSDSDFGTAIQFDNTNNYMRGLLPVVAGRKYEFIVKAKVPTASAYPATWRVIYYLLTDSFAAAGSANIAVSGSAANGSTVYTLTGILDCDALLTVQPTAKWIRPGVQRTNAGSTLRVGLSAWRDVTGREASAGFATAAAGSATTAGTHATNAGNSATAASTSATNAASSFNATLLTPIEVLPERPADQRALFYQTSFSATQTPTAMTELTAGTDASVAGEGNVWQNAGTTTSWISPRSWLPVVAGRTYRATIRFRNTVTGGTNGQLHVVGFTATGAEAGSVLVSNSIGGGVNTSWQTVTGDVTATQIIAANSSAAYIRPRVTHPANNFGQIAFVRLEDVTSQVAASGSATAAATQASNAATSASTAGTSATAAQSALVEARSVASAIAGVKDFTGDGTYHRQGTSALTTDLTTANYPSLTYSTVSGEGRVLQHGPSASAVQFLTTLGRFRPISGRRYRFVFRHRQVTMPSTGTPRFSYGYGFYSSADGYLASTQVTDDTHTAGEPWETYTLERSGDTLITEMGAGVWCRPFATIGQKTDSSTSNGTSQIAQIYVEDYTEEYNAAASATAAAGSASTASTHATNAGTSATSAQTSFTNAQTQAANALASAGTASGHASTASTHAASAAASATLATSFVGSGNFLTNTEFPSSLSTGWVSSGANSTFGVNLGGAGNYPIGANALTIYQSTAGTNEPVVYQEWSQTNIPVEGNRYYQAQVLAAAHRARVIMWLVFYDSSGAQIGPSYNNGGLTTVATGGTGLSNYTQLLIASAQAPATAVRATLILRKHDTTSGSDSYAWFVHPYFGYARSGQTAANNYSAGTGNAVESAFSSSITTNAASISTLQGSLATYEQKLLAGNPNLVPNSTFESGFETWTTASGVDHYVGGGYGKFAGVTAVSGSFIIPLVSENIPVYGSTNYTLSWDGSITSSSTASYHYMDIMWYQADGTTLISDTVQVNQNANANFSTDGSRRSALALTAASPSNAAFARVRWVVVPNGGTIASAFLRQIKLELGSTVTAYSQEASVLYQAGVQADHSGKLESYLQLTTNAGSAAEAFVALRSVASGGAETSSVSLGAREIHLYNPTSDTSGTWVRTLKIANGNAEFTGGLTAGTYIRLGSGVQWDVALRSKDFQGSDGSAISFGFDLGSLPDLTFQLNNLAPLTAGEIYNVYAENLTSTGFTLRAKIVTPGTSTNYNLTTDTAPGTGPTRQIDKAANPDATNNIYTFSGSGSATFQNEWDVFSKTWTSSGATVSVGIWQKVAGVWSMVDTVTVFVNGTNQQSTTTSFSFTESFTLSSGVEGFGITFDGIENGGFGSASGSVTDLSSVSWQSTANSGVRTATPSSQQTTVTVRPR